MNDLSHARGYFEGGVNGETLHMKTEDLIDCGDVRYGLFYGSYDKKRHLIPYIPYRTVSTPLCGAPGHMTATGSCEDLCVDCLLCFLNDVRLKTRWKVNSNGILGRVNAGD